MKKFFLNIWYTILIQFDSHRDDVPISWWIETQPFENFPLWLQRVVIAEDVIAQIKIQKYRAKKGDYMKELILKDKDLYLSEQDVKSNFDNIESCQVCAMGAWLLSATKFKNKLKFNDLGNGLFLKQDSALQNMLLSVFTPRDLALIEGAFEGYYNAFGERIGKSLASDKRIIELPPEEQSAIGKFFSKYPEADTRIMAIMQNIIDNKGEFKP